jgi:hypothetical protein
MEDRAAFLERMISISLAWFVFILLTEWTHAHWSAEIWSIARNVCFSMLVLAVFDALSIRLSAAGWPRPDLLAFLYGGLLLVICEKVGRSGQTGLLLNPGLFFLLCLPAAIGKKSRQGREFIPWRFSRAKLFATMSFLCFLSVVAALANLRNRTSTAVEITTIVAVLWFGWGMLRAVVAANGTTPTSPSKT